MEIKFDYIFQENESIQKLKSLEAPLKKLQNAKKKKISLDMRSVKTLDMAAVQVFASFVLSCKKAEKKVFLQGPLDPLLMDSLEEMDLVRISNDNSIIFEQLSGGYPIEC